MRFLEQIDGYPPTPDQLDVIMGGSEPALVIAGAGAGKTKTMALRVVYHVAAGHVAPGEALGLTFTEKAANELSSRISSMLRKASMMGSTALDEETAILSRPTVRTYNAFASAIALEHGLLVGVDPSSRLITDAERFQIANDLVKGWDAAEKPDCALSTLTKHVLSLSAAILDNQLTTDDVRAAMEEFDGHLGALDFRSLRKTGNERLHSHDKAHRLRLLALDIVDAYLDYKKTNRLIEFSDQVSVAHRVLAARPELAEQFRREHRLVLLDEYQDTSVSQALFLASLFGGGHDVTAVGDPNQAIYGWRGASADALSSFKVDFRAPDKPVAEYSLSTAFRNKGEILAVANTVAEPLRMHSKQRGLTVPPLEAFKPAGGEVDISFETFRDESYRAIAEDIARYRQEHETDNDGRGPSIAVLCRARSAFKPMGDALRELDIPFIEHGNQSAITQPEVKTVRGLLRAVVDPARGDGLIRLMSYLNIGSADIEAMNNVRRQIEKSQEISLSFAEVLRHRDRAKLSATGQSRLAMLDQWLAKLTEARFSRLDDLVGLAIRITGLETEVASRSVQGGIGRASLSILQRMAAGYADASEGATLDGFLSWLDDVEEHEHGDDADLPLADLALEAGGVTDDELENPHSVTIMTIHGAKGLEWDYVAIPEMRRGGFDLLTTLPRDMWLNKPGKIPQWIRADASSLPEWRWRAAADKEELAESFSQWDQEDMSEHENREIRRLAYVAMTRPRSRLLLAGYWYADRARGRKAFTDHAEGKNLKCGPSRLLLGLEVPVKGVGLVEHPEVLGDDDGETATALWPADLDRGTTAAMKEAAASVTALAPLTVDGAIEAVQGRSQWLKDSLADLLALLDREEADDLDLRHITANGAVAMASDPAEFRRSVERPIPTEPAQAARLGQQIHEYIALQYSAPRTGDLIDVSGEVEQVLGLDMLNPKVAELISAFESLEFAREAHPVAVEAPVDVTVAGVPMRGTIDAVFEDGVNPETGETRIRIVDWKTGRRPSEKDLTARELQLHLYRFAWAKLTGIREENIRATFAYLGEKDSSRRLHDVEPVPSDEVERRVADLISQVKAAG